MARVLLGMSGGVDSTVSAALLREQGHDVTGITFVMHGGGEASVPAAAAAARAAGADFVSADIREDFSRLVCDEFAKEYAAGRTPNPCAICNRRIKFPYLLDYARSGGFDFIATGHYASVRREKGVYRICAARDTAKDQSYFLYPLGQDVLSALLLPLSGMTKSEVRAYAARHGFECAGTKDSQDICFIPDGGAGEYVRRRLGLENAEGDFTDPDGRVLGRHGGVFRYTVGQRRGLGISASSRIFVSSILPDENRVVLCTEELLYKKNVVIGDCVFSDGMMPEQPFRSDVRLRYTKKPAPAEVIPLGDGRLEARFDEPQRAPAPGQAAVFYDGGAVLGGGTIRSAR